MYYDNPTQQIFIGGKSGTVECDIPTNANDASSHMDGGELDPP